LALNKKFPMEQEKLNGKGCQPEPFAGKDTLTLPTPGIILCLLLFLFVIVLFVVVLFVAVLCVILHPPVGAAKSGSDTPRKLLYFDDGAAARQLVEFRQPETPGYIRFLRMRLAVVLAVVHEKYWLAILNKDKLIEFRSSRPPILLEAGDSLLFALAMRHRKIGKDALILAQSRVSNCFI
jgi:hypothetical protein